MLKKEEVQILEDCKASDGKCENMDEKCENKFEKSVNNDGMSDEIAGKPNELMSDKPGRRKLSTEESCVKSWADQVSLLLIYF